MAALSPASAAAIARLRSYVPPPATWHSLPVTRRAAVLILLFADKRGDLRVVLTMRASTLSSYAGQAALPGGKADSLSESALHVARREAAEEIGLPLPLYPPESKTPAVANPDSDISASLDPLDPSFSPPTPSLPYPFQIEHLCQLPTNLARTELGVRPCVAFLHATAPKDHKGVPVDAEATLIPRLDAKEVAAVFSGPLHNFLRTGDEYPVSSPVEQTSANQDDTARSLDRGCKHADQDEENRWYKGQWIDWHHTRWRMHSFFVPVAGQIVTRPRQPSSSSPSQPPSSKQQQQPPPPPPLASPNPNESTYPRLPPGSSALPYRDHPSASTTTDPLDGLSRFRVFGMTARILVDCARVAYGEEPEFEHNSHFGDEELIQALVDDGRMKRERARGEEFGKGDVSKILERTNKKGKL